MTHRDAAWSGLGLRQFSVLSLLECVTWCGVVAAFSGSIGPAATCCLMAMCVALLLEQGPWAVAMFAASVLTTPWRLPASPVTANHGSDELAAFVVAILLAGLVSGWYCWRRRPRQASACLDDFTDVTPRARAMASRGCR